LVLIKVSLFLYLLLCPHLSTIRLLRNTTSRELANLSRLILVGSIPSEYAQGHPRQKLNRLKRKGGSTSGILWVTFRNQKKIQVKYLRKNLSNSYKYLEGVI